ncbi:MAG TPA: nucleotidyltransferase domain-containing protein [bacterium]|nr:nucleotidyltransferase domain-containing protein [bacterium]
MIREKRIKHNIFPLLKKLEEEIKSDEDVIFFYLFGSYGKNKISPLSDIDFAFYLKEGIDYFDKKEELIEIINTVLKTDEVDVVILNEISPSFFKEILKTRKIILSKDANKRIEFELRKLREFFDTEKLRNFSEQALIRRIKERKYGIANSSKKSS